MSHQITHIRKSGYPYDCSCITHVKTSTGNEYMVSKVIDMILGKLDGIRHYFYVIDPKDQSQIQVIPVPTSNPTYIRTRPNDTPDDNLLKLPSF